MSRTTTIFNASHFYNGATYIECRNLLQYDKNIRKHCLRQLKDTDKIKTLYVTNLDCESVTYLMKWFDLTYAYSEVIGRYALCILNDDNMYDTLIQVLDDGIPMELL